MNDETFIAGMFFYMVLFDVVQGVKQNSEVASINCRKICFFDKYAVNTAKYAVEKLQSNKKDV